MKPVFYSAPVLFPRPNYKTDMDTRSGMELFCRRAMELWRAAALIDASEPGLITTADRETARRKGTAAGQRVLKGCQKGKAKVAFFRALTSNGLCGENNILQENTDLHVWLLEDRCKLADVYLRAVSDAALQNGAECILCPSPLRRDRLEAVFLPGCGAAFLSMNAAKKTNCVTCKRVRLDRIPAAERKQALSQTMRENTKWIEALTLRAAAQLKNAEILRDLNARSCAAEKQIL